MTASANEPSDDMVRSYHGRPIVKEPEWTWEVPWYLFAGGLGGAASVLGAGAALTGNEQLAHRARLIAAGAAMAGPPLLISDLGRPKRFLNMLRVFKPTSVMSVGSWTLAIYSGAAVTTAGLSLLGRWRALRATADGASAGIGLLMATYTGALVADTAVPVWHEARKHLPALFAASGVASAGAALSLITAPEHAGPARRAAVIGAVAELGVERAMTHHLDDIGEVYHEGEAGRYRRAASIATAAGAALVAGGGRRRRWMTTVGSVALLAGAVCERWAVFHAGFQSARDPAAVVRPQRARMDRASAGRDGTEPVIEEDR